MRNTKEKNREMRKKTRKEERKKQKECKTEKEKKDRETEASANLFELILQFPAEQLKVLKALLWTDRRKNARQLGQEYPP